jgi:gamma-glutamylcysteine synthetase
MSDRTKLLKKAVLTGVGATSSVDRVKDALKDAMQDLVKVGQELIEDLEEKGKVKTESAESFLKGFKDEAVKRTEDIEKQVSAKVSKTMKKAAKEFGFVTMEQYEQLLERLALVEEHAGITQPEHIGDDQAEEGEDNHNHDNEGNGDASSSKKKKNKRAEG